MNQTQADTVTLVVRHQVHRRHEQRYDTWLHRAIDTAGQSQGHLAVDVARESQANFVNFTCILRFDQLQHMQAWLDSNVRKQLVAEVQPLLSAGDNTEILMGKDFWFMPDNTQQPPALWKQAVISFLVILPLSLLIPQLWQPLFHLAPLLSSYLMSNVLITLSIVLLVVYVCMPMATRVFAAWLTPKEARP
ncbi:antibiotic biosynthesis monooxygenase [Pseudomonas brassicacearum]|uniref:antibiotic biosynthesis monooxygenase n=1 Tax=Pseudomonas brassicacearum TaxID=930166 RepID=UPI000F4A7D1F|nr:antibiotic biosynthesis monooxygenase [Pseudomonas brassicacearum]ROM80265.1 antibiotic biosynthesis monooxygenase [Pseudomonas brassicacearum]